jgi:hypothetical protein
MLCGSCFGSSSESGRVTYSLVFGYCARSNTLDIPEVFVVVWFSSSLLNQK